MQKSPSETILRRAKAYNLCDVRTVYDCYDDQSEFMEIFPDLEIYKKQFNQLTKVYGSIKSKIIDEKIKGNLAIVCYEDRVVSEEDEVVFNCKCYLKKNENDWKILKEEKEIIAPES